MAGAELRHPWEGILVLTPIACADMHLSAQVFDDMQARGVLADVVTCCSLINALERGGQWQLAEQLFCRCAQPVGNPRESTVHCTGSWKLLLHLL